MNTRAGVVTNVRGVANGGTVNKLDEGEETLSRELESHKELIRQHARTICIMEERLVNMAKQLSDARAEALLLRKENHERNSQKTVRSLGLQVDIGISHFGWNHDAPVLLNNAPETVKLRNAVKAIREGETAELTRLRGQVAAAEARISDAASLACEEHKVEAEAAAERNRRLQSQLDEARLHLQQLTAATKVLKRTISEQNKAFERTQAVAQGYHDALVSESAKVASLQLERNQDSVQPTSKSPSCRLESLRRQEELVRLGITCQGERHGQTIAAQRIALGDLRQRLHQLAASGPRGLTPNNLISLEEAHRREILNLRRQLHELHSRLTNADACVSASPQSRSQKQSTGTPDRLPTGLQVKGKDAHKISLKAIIEALQACFMDQHLNYLLHI
uniref:Coiled-coil domain-containing protein 150 n=1 Tax=Mesocestoides corti TaxID=53468 RepID=A0A5K3EUF5_MESCO